MFARKREHIFPWVGISALSIVFVGMTGWIWFLADSGYRPNEGQLTSDENTKTYLRVKFAETDRPLPELIPTGVFIQSLRFNNSNEVNITGYLWQRYPGSVDPDTCEEENICGFVFPEAVDTGSNIIPRREYVRRTRDETVIGWYFESTLRQQFKYDRYPLDHKTVWIRMWHKNFESSYLLIPDLGAYKGTGVTNKFGYDQEIVLGNWVIDDTFFDFKWFHYDTNFGLAPKYADRPSNPELYFNVVIRRNFLNTFVVHLVPLLTVAILLFSMLLLITDDEKKAGVLGFSTSGIIGVCASLFFVIMLAHVQLREQFAGARIVYMEFFYLTMYVLIIGVAANTYLFSLKLGTKTWFGNFIYHRENLIPKTLYWPVLTGSIVLFSLWLI